MENKGTPMHFYIDFENVSEPGFKGIENLSANDTLKIFVSDKARKMDLLLIEKIQATGCSFTIERTSENKKNSMDFHIVADLGLEMGLSSEKNVKSVIVSKDRDFDSAIGFFKKKGFDVSSSKNIADVFGVNEDRSIPVEKSSKAANTEKAKRSAKPVKALSAEKSRKSEFSEICENLELSRNEVKKVEELLKSSSRLQDFHNSIRDSFKDEDYRAIYKSFKNYYRTANK